MPREFDTFIIVPELADSPLKSYHCYLDAEIEDTPEMASLRFKGIVASYIHFATELEEATVAFFEQSDTQLRNCIQKALDGLEENFLINSNTFLEAVSILPENNGNYHLAKLTFATPKAPVVLYTYGTDVVEANGSRI